MSELNSLPATSLRQPDGRLLPELQPIAEKLNKAKALVLFDLDRTALNDNYQATNPDGLRAVVDSLQKKDVIVGILSDTPRQSLLQFADLFGVKGPLIYEMAGIHFQEEEYIDIVLDPGTMEFFRGFRDRFFSGALTHFPDSPNQKYLITKTKDRNKEKRENTNYPGYDRGLFVNPYRLVSFGLWAEGIQAAKKFGIPINYPMLKFKKRAEILVNIQDLPKTPIILIASLEIDPDFTNVMMIHRNDRRISPTSILQAHYGMLQTDNNLLNDGWRHTMLKLAPRDVGPVHTKEAFTGVMNHAISQTMRNMDTSRLKGVNELISITIDSIDAISSLGVKILAKDILTKIINEAHDHQIMFALENLFQRQGIDMPVDLKPIDARLALRSIYHNRGIWKFQVG